MVAARYEWQLSGGVFISLSCGKALHYIIALRQNQPLQRALVNAEGWWVLQDERGKPVQGIELMRFAYQANTWSKPRWVGGPHTAAHRTARCAQG